MKAGLHFDIPEKPDDMLLLWERSLRLSANALPEWLPAEDASGYREVCPRRETITGMNRKAYDAELRQLAELGLIVDDARHESGRSRVYLAAPKPQDVWSIGLYCGNSPTNLRPCDAVSNPILCRDDVSDVTATFVADPFLVRDEAVWHMFFEVMNWHSGKGEIGLATSADGINWRYEQIVLGEEFHLSYPYVFQWQGRYFMVPESFQAGEVRLYEATAFPRGWELRNILIEGDYLVDSSIVRYAGKWWLWVDASPDGGHDRLRLYSSEELSGLWQEHPRSPIVERDPRHARPAGRVIEWNAKLLRFAQNCEPAYGTDVRCFEITTLTSTDYEERPIGACPMLGPSGAGWNAEGMHHVDPHRVGDDDWIAAVDGWQLRGGIS